MVGLRSVGVGKAGASRGLACLAGRALPPELWQGAARVERLSPGALHDLWTVLDPCFGESPQLDQLLGRYCSTHEVALGDVAVVLKVVHAMVRGAASVGLDKQAFASDLARVWADQGELHEVLLSRYDEVIATLRQRLLERVLVKHGNVLRSLEWRIDRVMGSDDAPWLAEPVAMVTLGYQHREATGHLSLQLTPDELRRMAAMFTKLAEQAERLGPVGGRDDEAP